MAWLSLLLAIVSYPLVILMGSDGIPAFWFTSILAIVLGHLAVRRVRTSANPVRGLHLARAGLVLAYLIGIILPLALGLLTGWGAKLGGKGRQTMAISNCRQIITALRIYAADHNGQYPDAARPSALTSNEAFRELFTSGTLKDETIFGTFRDASYFGSPQCPFRPDGKIGQAPDFVRALEPGENHWALVKGQTNSSDESMALVFENPAVASWPPEWATRKPDRPARAAGDAWYGDKIIIGTNDSSVTLLHLVKTDAPTAPLAPPKEGKSPFAEQTPTPVILNVAKKKGQ